MPGPPPKPTALKLAQGNPGKRALNENEPVLRPSFRVPPAPRALRVRRSGRGKSSRVWGLIARDTWRRTAKELWAAGLLPRVSEEGLVRYCQAAEILAEAMEDIARRGNLVQRKGGSVMNPSIRIARAQAEIMHRLEAEFGMTPASKSRISVRPATTAVTPSSANPADARKARFFDVARGA